MQIPFFRIIDDEWSAIYFSFVVARRRGRKKHSASFPGRYFHLWIFQNPRHKIPFDQLAVATSSKSVYLKCVAKVSDNEYTKHKILPLLHDDYTRHKQLTGQRHVYSVLSQWSVPIVQFISVYRQSIYSSVILSTVIDNG